MDVAEGTEIAHAPLRFHEPVHNRAVLLLFFVRETDNKEHVSKPHREHLRTLDVRRFEILSSWRSIERAYA